MSYVIARTLGIIDDTRAATSDPDKSEVVAGGSNPTILVSDESHGPALSSDLPTPSSSAFAAAHEQEDRLHAATEHHAQLTPSDRVAPTHWFTGGTERLSGVGIFSPVASRAGSPAAERRSFLSGDSGPRRRSGSGSWQNSLRSSAGAFTPRKVGEEGETEPGTHLRLRKTAVPPEVEAH